MYVHFSLAREAKWQGKERDNTCYIILSVDYYALETEWHYYMTVHIVKEIICSYTERENVDESER